MTDKPKQPFLKKGTRQFLSNAQVRSLNTKPKIVEFGEQEDYEPQPKVAQATFGNDRSKSQRPVTQKLPSKADRDRDRPLPSANRRGQADKVLQAQDPSRKIEQFKKQIKVQDSDAIFVAKAKSKYTAPPLPSKQPTRQQVQRKAYSPPRSSTNNMDIYLNKRKPQNSMSSQQPLSTSKNSQSKSSSKHVSLAGRQEQVVTRPAAASSISSKNRSSNKYVFEDEPEEEQNFDNQYRRVGATGMTSSPKKIPERKPEPPKVQQKHYIDDEYEIKDDMLTPDQNSEGSENSSEEKTKRTNEYNFDDEEEWHQPIEGKMKRSLLKKELRQHKDKLYKEIQSHKAKEPLKDHDQEEDNNGQDQYAEVEPSQPSPVNAPKSKLVQKFFYGNDKVNSKQHPKNTPSFTKQSSQGMTMDDVPEDIKLKIIQEAVFKMKERLQQEVDRVKNQGNEVRRVKNKYQEELRLMERAKKDFDKEMEQKKLQFEQYMKEEKAKIAKDKKVIKDSLENKYTRKQKQEIDELKKQIEDTKQQKRKAEGKLRMQIQRLKKKLQQEQSFTRQLQEEVKILQLGRIRERQTITKEQTAKQTVKQAPVIAPSNQITVIQPKKKDEIDPNIEAMKQNEFSLVQLPKDTYRYETNIYYRQYCGDRQSEDQLESEKYEQQRIKRTYKSGRVEHQYFKKYIKQIFPNGYTIVHHVNGDIKQTLPQGVVIYYVHGSQIVEFTINPSKKILFFAKQDQVQMTVETPNGPLHEVYDGCTLNRKLPDGNSQIIEATGGKVITKPNNTKVSYNNGSKQISYPKQLRNF